MKTSITAKLIKSDVIEKENILFSRKIDKKKCIKDKFPNFIRFSISNKVNKVKNLNQTKL